MALECFETQCLKEIVCSTHLIPSHHFSCFLAVVLGYMYPSIYDQYYCNEHKLRCGSRTTSWLHIAFSGGLMPCEIPFLYQNERRADH